MARARNIKPGILKNEVLGVADPLLTLLFEGLWLLADREGRLEDRPLRIKAEVFPYREGLDIEAMLNWLQAKGFILRYEAQGKRCIVVLEFVKHQNPHKNEPESVLPPPEAIGTASDFLGSARADSLIPDSLIPDTPAPAPAPTPKVSKSKHEYTPAFEHAWTLYPPRPGASKVDAFKAWNARLREGATVGALTRGVEAYAAYVKAMGTEPQFVKQAETFFGPARHFESDWTPPPPQQKSGAPPITVASNAAERTAAEQAAQAEHARQAVKPPAEVLARLGDLTKQLKANA